MAPRIAVAQIGARRGYAIPSFLQRSGMLAGLYTDLCANVWWVRLASRLVPVRYRPGGLKRLLARKVADVPDEAIRCFWRYGLSRVPQRDEAGSVAARVRHYVRANMAFCQEVLRAGLGDANGIYVFNGAGLEILQHARRHGLRTILDQTSAAVAYDERLLARERERWPGWEAGGMEEADWRPLADRERAEWELADLILCGSEYVRDSIGAEGGPVERCVVVPYGKRLTDFSPAKTKPASDYFQVICVGTVQLRKGVQYLIEAARLLSDVPVEITLVGPIDVSDEAVHQLREVATVTGPVPRSEVAAIYGKADAFVLPTVSEGSAGVVYEALASGLPVITTPNAGSVVRDGVDGFLVPIADATALADRIRQLAVSPALAARMGEQARRRAAEFTFDSYQERLIREVQALYLKGVPTSAPVAAEAGRP